MVQELSYTTLSIVIESWEELRRMDNYEEVAGSLLFQRLFRECPQAKVLFGFPITADPDSQELLKSKRFLMHASYLIQMLDIALDMLGPDIELLSEIMLELGQKHVKYGVKPEMFPTMGKCLLLALQQTLPGTVMTPVVVDAWKECYDVLSKEMILAMKSFSEEDQ